MVCIYKQISPLIYLSIHTKLQIHLFGMYFYIPTVFLIIKNTYHFVNYQFSMYLQTFFPLIFTTYTYKIVNMQFGMYFTDVLTAKVPFYTYYEKSQSTFSHILHSLSLQLIPPLTQCPLHLHSEFRILNSFPLQLRFPLTIPLPPNSSFLIHN